jgi:hypothetical protein
MAVGGQNSIAEATKSIAIGTNVRISSSAENAVAVSAYTSSSSKSCETTVPGSLTLCADKNVTIEGSALVVNGVEGSALVVNGVDILMTTSDLKAELFNTKGELADLKANLNTKGEKGELADVKAKLLSTTSELADLKAKLVSTTSELAELVDLKNKTKDELADLKANVAALLARKAQSQTSPASVSLVGTLLALSLTAAAVA